MTTSVVAAPYNTGATKATSTGVAHLPAVRAGGPRQGLTGITKVIGPNF